MPAGNTKVTITDGVTTNETLSNVGEGAGAAGIVKASAASKNWKPKEVSPSLNPASDKVGDPSTTTNESDCDAANGTWSDDDGSCR